MAETRLPFGIPESELRLSFSRSSGPGGQNVNKTATKATLHWDVLHSRTLPADVRTRLLAAHGSRLTRAGELVIQSQRTRDQARNADDCVEKLAALLRALARPRRARRPTRPGRAAVERRLSEKRHRGRAKRERGAPRRDD
jgi:ribosome-associated protein